MLIVSEAWKATYPGAAQGLLVMHNTGDHHISHHPVQRSSFSNHVNPKHPANMLCYLGKDIIGR